TGAHEDEVGQCPPAAARVGQGRELVAVAQQGAGADGLDEDTVAALTIELAKLADRIDVACIAHSSGTTP
ncbi:DUF6213 family protein, partial [Streptomyces nigra]